MSKVCVVTGGGSGIGKAVAAMLPNEYTVVITGRNLEKLQKTADSLNKDGHHIVARTCDVSNREDVKKLAEYASSLGEVVKVFNCAGVSGSMAHRDTIIRINALGTLYVNQEFYKVMNGGVICNTASNSAFIPFKFFLPSKKTYELAITDEDRFVEKMSKKAKITKDESNNSQMAYMFSKNFVKWFTEKCSFKYLETKGIRVFSVSPGFVKTPMTDLEQGEATEMLLSYSGLHRGAEPEEIAFLMACLADERCGYFVGADALADGGCINNGYNMGTCTKYYDKKSLKENW